MCLFIALFMLHSYEAAVTCDGCVPGKCSDADCTECLQGYYLLQYDNFGICTSKENCEVAGGRTNPVDKTCELCSNCVLGKCKGTSCSECLDGFLLLGGDGGDTCITIKQCKDTGATVNLINKTCELCPNCVVGKCIGIVCSQCAASYFLFDGFCETKEVCESIEGNVANEESHICESPGIGCSFCQEGKCKDSHCSECKNGYYFYDDGENIDGCITLATCKNEYSGTPNDISHTCDICKNCVSGKCKFKICSECSEGYYLYQASNIATCLTEDECLNQEGGSVDNDKKICEISAGGCSYCLEGKCSDDFVCSECRSGFYYFYNFEIQGCITKSTCEVLEKGIPNDSNKICEKCENCVSGKCNVHICTECADGYYLFKAENAGECLTKEECEGYNGQIQSVDKTCIIRVTDCPNCEAEKCTEGVCTECALDFYLYSNLCLTKNQCEGYGRVPNSVTKTCDDKNAPSECENCEEGKCIKSICSECLLNYYLYNNICLTKDQCEGYGRVPNSVSKTCDDNNVPSKCENCVENKCNEAVCSECISGYFLIRTKDQGICLSKEGCEIIEGKANTGNKACEIQGVGCSFCASGKCDEYFICSQCSTGYYLVNNKKGKGCITKEKCIEIGLEVKEETKLCENDSKYEGGKGNKPLGSGGIAGIVVGVIAAVAIVVGLCVYFLVIKKKGGKNDSSGSGNRETEKSSTI